MGGDSRTHGASSQYGYTAEWCHQWECSAKRGTVRKLSSGLDETSKLVRGHFHDLAVLPKDHRHAVHAVLPHGFQKGKAHRFVDGLAIAKDLVQILFGLLFYFHSLLIFSHSSESEITGAWSKEPLAIRRGVSPDRLPGPAPVRVRPPHRRKAAKRKQGERHSRFRSVF